MDEDDAPGPADPPAPLADARAVLAAAAQALRAARRGGYRRRAKKGHRKRKNTVAKKQLTAQVVTYNRSGAAKTRDHLMAPDGVKKLKVKGKGQWKQWTPETDDGFTLSQKIIEPMWEW